MTEKIFNEDYKIRITTHKHDLLELLINRGYLTKYHHFESVRFLVAGNNQPIRSCNEKIFNELHEDYQEITDVNFINKFKSGYCTNCGSYLGLNAGNDGSDVECNCGRLYSV